MPSCLLAVRHRHSLDHTQRRSVLRLCNTDAPPDCPHRRWHAPSRLPPPPRPAALWQVHSPPACVLHAVRRWQLGVRSRPGRARARPARLRSCARGQRTGGARAFQVRLQARHVAPQRLAVLGGLAHLALQPLYLLPQVRCECGELPMQRCICLRLFVNMRRPMDHHRLSGTTARGCRRVSGMLASNLRRRQGPPPVRGALAGLRRGSRRWAAPPALPPVPARRGPCVLCAAGALRCSRNSICNSGSKLTSSDTAQRLTSDTAQRLI